MLRSVIVAAACANAGALPACANAGALRSVVVAATCASVGALAPTWSIAMNLGREDGSSMPKEWAASGARFFLQTSVELSEDTTEFDEPFLGRRETRRAVAQSAQYTGLDGRRDVAVADGAWVLAEDRQPKVMRFWLDFSGAGTVESRGVELPAERLFFTASAFDTDGVGACVERNRCQIETSAEDVRSRHQALTDDPRRSRGVDADPTS